MFEAGAVRLVHRWPGQPRRKHSAVLGHYFPFCRRPFALKKSDMCTYMTVAHTFWPRQGPEDEGTNS